jgi:hypothetical protein
MPVLSRRSTSEIDPLDLLRLALAEQAPDRNGQSRTLGRPQSALALNEFLAHAPLTNEQERQQGRYDAIDAENNLRRASVADDERKQASMLAEAKGASAVRAFENRRGVTTDAADIPTRAITKQTTAFGDAAPTRRITRVGTSNTGTEAAREAASYTDPNFNTVLAGRAALARTDPKVVAANPFVRPVMTGAGGASASADADDPKAAALAGLEPGMASQVKMLADYKLPVPSGTALKSPYWQDLLQRAALYDPTFDVTQYPSRQKLRNDFTSGAGAKNIRSLNTAVGHLDTLNEAAKALHNVSIPWANWGKNILLTAKGDPRVTKFTTAATAVENELASLFKGTGATDQEIKQWREALNASESPAQLTGAIQSAIELMHSRQNALQQQWETGMGKPADFEIVSPQSRKVLERLAGGGMGAPQEYDFVNGHLVPRGASH